MRTSLPRPARLALKKQGVSASFSFPLLLSALHFANSAFLAPVHSLALIRPRSVESLGSASQRLAMSSSAGDQERYRPCAGALVFNREKQLLCGNRKDVPGSWQLPQGGIDEGENPTAAAGRELYEEMGVICPDDVLPVQTLDETVSYKVPPGTWLEKQGFVGQRMYWTLYFYPGSDMPKVDLSGLGGEKPEFTEVKWLSWTELLAANEFKRSLNEQLREIADPAIDSYLVQNRLG